MKLPYLLIQFIGLCTKPSLIDAFLSCTMNSAGSNLSEIVSNLYEIEAVIFDLDGTLLDTETLSTQAIQKVLDRFGCEFTWELKERSLGQRGDTWSRMVVNELNLQSKLEPVELIHEWERNLAELCPHVEKMRGAESIISLFKERKVKMGIATSSHRSSVDVKRSRHETIFSPMEVIVTGDDPEVAFQSILTLDPTEIIHNPILDIAS